MSQVHKSVVAQPRQLEQRYGAAAAIATGIAAAAIAGVLIFSSITSVPPAVQTQPRADLVDGWMPGALAAQAAHLERLQDGYMPGLIAARSSGALVDGYLPGLIAAGSSEPAGASELRDGWESGLTR